MEKGIKLYIGNENLEPTVVYLSSFNSRYDYWVCNSLNKEDILLIEEKDLIDFEYTTYKKLLYEWKIENQDKIKNHYIKLLNELK